MNAQISAGALVSGTPGETAARAKNGTAEKPEAVSYIDSANDGIVGVRLFINDDQVYCALLNSNSLNGNARGTSDDVSKSGAAVANRSAREQDAEKASDWNEYQICLLYTSPSPRDATLSRMPSSA